MGEAEAAAGAGAGAAAESETGAGAAGAAEAAAETGVDAGAIESGTDTGAATPEIETGSGTEEEIGRGEDDLRSATGAEGAEIGRATGLPATRRGTTVGLRASAAERMTRPPAPREAARKQIPLPVEASKKGMEKGRRSGESHSRKPWLARTTPAEGLLRKSKKTQFFFVRGKLPAWAKRYTKKKKTRILAGAACFLWRRRSEQIRVRFGRAAAPPLLLLPGFVWHWCDCQSPPC